MRNRKRKRKDMLKSLFAAMANKHFKPFLRRYGDNSLVKFLFIFFLKPGALLSSIK